MYFLPGVSVCHNVKQLPRETELDTVLDGAFWSPLRTKAGPEGQAGMLLHIEPAPGSGGRQAALGYNPEKQHWRPVRNKDKKIVWWYGWEIDSPPTSLDLIRPDVTDGLPLRLNGQPFHIPLATLSKTDLTQLPRRYDWMDGGIKLVVKDRYADLCERCSKQFDWLCSHLGFDVDPESIIMKDYEQVFLAIDLLNVNYRVAGPEVCFLDLLDTTSVIKVIEYAVGWPYFEAQERQRKKARAGSEPAVTLNMPSGEMADSPATNPVS